MKQVGKMKLYSFEELLDEDYGKVGTPERDAFEQSVDDAVQAYRVGEAIKQAREAQQLLEQATGPTFKESDWVHGRRLCHRSVQRVAPCVEGLGREIM